MLVFPNCKINIGLRITAKRPDGYHDIETVFFPVPWCDALEIIEAASLSLVVTGINIPGDPDNNLCIKAWHLLKKDFPELPEVAIFLHKTIPAGAGLGGGSSNGAFMLKALNQKFNLGIVTEKMIDYALKLGSDCPFFIINKPVIAKGRGEIMELIDLSLSGKYLVLENPGIHINTGWAFGQINPAKPAIPLRDIVESPIENWEGNGLINDFTKPVIQNHPEIQTIINNFKSRGAIYASMTGTGSTCFGIFEKEPDFPTPLPNNSGRRNIIFL